MPQFFLILENYLNYFFESSVGELIKLVDVVEMQDFGSKYYISSPYKNIVFKNLPNEFGYLYLDEIVLRDWFLKELNSLGFFIKIFLFFNIFLSKLFFFQITPVTFWLIPISMCLFFGVLILFLIRPKNPTFFVWQLSKFLVLLILVYQLALLCYFLNMYQAGFILKVGLNGAFNLPFNLALAKLLSFSFILFAIFFTILFYLEYYTKVLLSIKPELCSILFFLGFGSGMVFLQNDLFSIFIYFEIISFCIYGLLFLQKRTNAQLHGLVRYVLFSLWVSTCYIFGIAMYISAKNDSTNLANFNSITKPTDSIYEITELPTVNFIQLFQNHFELLLAITFILVYFLFKLGAGPFFTWTIEVYNACPTSNLFIVSILPKLVYVPMLFFILFFNFIEFFSYWSILLLSTGLLTIFVGSFGILLSDKLKEIYAWSSIIHTGNLLVMLSCITSVTLAFVMFYLFSYYLISCGFIILIASLQNKNTGWFIKTSSELNGLTNLHASFYFLIVLLFASAAGFTPFLSFFMKFSLLSVLSTQYGIIFTILVGLLNIVGGVIYLKILRNIIGFNFNLFYFWTKNVNSSYIELNMPYAIALLLNFIITLIIFSFFYYKDFIALFTFFANPYIVQEGPFLVYI